MHELLRRVGAENTNQFASWFDSETRHWSKRPQRRAKSSEAVQLPETQNQKKWYRIIEGRQAVSERSLSELRRLFPDAKNYFFSGHSRLFEAMWGDIDELWDIASFTGHSLELPGLGSLNHTPQLIDPHTLETWVDASLPFTEALYNFECSLYGRLQFGESLTIRDLSEAIALYRIHIAISRLCLTDGVGAYRCVRMCLDSEDVAANLKSLGAHRAKIDIFEAVSTELLHAERFRLRSEPAYQMSIGVDTTDHYAVNPFAYCSHEARMQTLRIG